LIEYFVRFTFPREQNSEAIGFKIDILPVQCCEDDTKPQQI